MAHERHFGPLRLLGPMPADDAIVAAPVAKSTARWLASPGQRYRGALLPSKPRKPGRRRNEPRLGRWPQWSKNSNCDMESTASCDGLGYKSSIKCRFCRDYFWGIQPCACLSLSRLSFLPRSVWAVASATTKRPSLLSRSSSAKQLTTR